MKAAILQDWHHIEVREVERPAPAPGDVIVEVAFAGVCGSDVHILHGTNPIAKPPLIPGHEFSGRVRDIGVGVSGLEPGQRVAVQPLVFCGQCPACRRGTPHVCEKLVVVGANRHGAFAQFVRVPAEAIFPVPDDIPDETAALAEPFSIAMHSARRGGLRPEDRVMIIGAGAIGLFSAFLIRHLGARQIHLSEPNERRRAYARSFGLEVTDPTEPEALARVRSASEEEGYDLVIETSGVDAGLEFASSAAAVRGRIVTLGFPGSGYARYNMTRGIVKELSLIGSRVCTRAEFGEALEAMIDMQRSGSLDFSKLTVKPRPLEELAAAIKDVAEAREIAKILIRPE